MLKSVVKFITLFVCFCLFLPHFISSDSVNNNVFAEDIPANSVVSDTYIELDELAQTDSPQFDEEELLLLSSQVASNLLSNISALQNRRIISIRETISKINTNIFQEGKKTAESSHELNERVSQIDLTRPVIALTFDDGPHYKITNRILDVLEQNNLRATFFVVGNRISSDNAYETLRRADALKCEIGNHTYEHPNLTKLSDIDIYQQFEKTNDAVYSVLSKPTTLFRPTFGAYNDVVKNNIDAPFILWSVDSNDWKDRNSAILSERLLSTIKDGDVILMHDLYETTAETVEIIVPLLIEQGYQFVTVSELFALKEVTLESRTPYRRP